MQDTYVVRLKNNILACFYYANDKSICVKYHGFGKWGQHTVLFENALPNFTVNLSGAGGIYIFCQDSEGSIILISKLGEEGEWSRKTVLKNQSDSVHTILFHAFIRNNRMSLIYNIPGEENAFKLISQSLDDTGTWAKPQQIDDIAPLRDKLFYIQHISPEHFVAYYKAHNKENNIGYREIVPDKWGGFNYIHQTAYNIADCSFLTTNTSVHALYTVKSMFSSQLIYRKRENGSFTPPAVICEGQRMENCLLGIVDNAIYAFVQLNGQLYVSVSRNNGISFTKPELYKNKFCINPVKASYLSLEPMEEEKYFIREVYVDSHNPWDIQIMPDLYDDFYHAAPSVIPPGVAAASISQNNKQAFGAYDNVNAKMEKLMKENADKDEQLAYMSNMLKDRGRRLDDAKDANEKMKAVYNKSLNELKQRVDQLEKENSRLLEEVKNLALRTTNPVAQPVEPKQLNEEPPAQEPEKKGEEPAGIIRPV